MSDAINRKASRQFGAGGGTRDFEHSGTGRSARFHSSTEAVALQVPKRGRLVTVCKIVWLDGEPVLAVCWRNQQGTRVAVSLPLAAIAYAEAHGARRFVLRDDRLGVARTITLADMRRKGWIGAEGELYIKLEDMMPAPWRPWAYAEKTVRLGDEAEAEPVQLGLGLLGVGV